MNEQEFNDLVSKVQAAAGQKISEEVKAALKGMDPEALKALAEKDVVTREDLGSLAKAEDIDSLKVLVNEAMEKANQAIEGGRSEQPKSLAEQIKEQLLANKEGFGELKTNKNASMNITVKAVGNMTIAASATGRVARTEREPGSVALVRRDPFVMDLVRVSPTTANTIYWVERQAPEGAPAFTAEGAAKPQIDWTYVEKSRAVVKVAAWTKISKEMLDDIDGLSQDIADELTERIMLTADDSLLTGDGTSSTLVGIAENATAFAPGASLANLVNDANEMDVLRAAIAQVRRNEFQPNYIVIHPDKAAIMDLQKSGTDDHYLLPPFITADGQSVRGIPIVTNTNVGSDAFYVGDFSRYNVKVREEISIQLGYDSDDWTKNFITPLAEMRLAGYIAENHYGAIVTGTFTVAKALLDPAVADA